MDTSANKPDPITTEQLASAYHKIQQQFCNAESHVESMQNELNLARNELLATENPMQTPS